ncbi:MAG: hypothetical protein A2X36_06385 [Elusimicrobia bacterium GWA2_69_24]|nr:MAG: hypothetical protein A2X36_06385 [Elusimicrobia bacterium GWA2_69_24]HBL17077.1 hypothetical protein [Elusimicrobiota bacterium]
MTRLHLAVLAAFAVTQPLFDIVARNPGLLVAHRPTPAETLLLTFLAAAVPALLTVLLAEAARRAGPRAGDAAGWLLAALLAALIVLPPLNRMSALPWWLGCGAAAAFGAAAASSLRSSRVMRSFTAVLSPALLLFPLLFLASKGIRPLILSPAAAPAAAFAKGTAGLPPIVFVVFDEFPLISLLGADRRIDASRFPNFAALSGEAFWFRNAATVTDDTLTAVPSLLTGRYPEDSRPPVWTAHPPNLFTLSAGAYTLDVHETNTLLCPPELCPEEPGRPHEPRGPAAVLSDWGVVYLHLVLPAPLRRRLPPVTQDWKGFTDFQGALVRRTEASLNEREAVFRSFISGLTPGPRPTLHFLHAMLPHPPFIYLPSGRTYSRRSYVPKNERVVPGLSADGERWSADAAAVQQAWQRHLLQVGFTDRLLGDLLRRLRDTGLYDRSLLVFVSDHGAAFEAGGHRRILSERNAGSILPIPLFIKLPGQTRGEVVDRAAASVDVLPTLAGAIGLRLAVPADGEDLLRPGPGRRTRVFMDRQGRRRELPLSEAARDAALSVQRRLFGAGAGWPSLFRAGASSRLLGRDVAAVPSCPPLDAEAELDQAALLRATDSAVSPALLTGRIRSASPLASADAVAVAVDGTVRAVAPLTPDPDGARFSILWPEESLRGKGGAVELFAVPRDGGRLCPLRSAPPGYTLARDASGTGSIVDTAGTRYPIAAGRLTGRVERAFVAQDNLVLRGWALDARRRVPPAALLVFAGDRFVFRGTASMPRPRVAANLRSPALRDCGFEFAIPKDLFGDLRRSEVRVFALSSDGAAGELSYWRQ